MLSPHKSPLRISIATMETSIFMLLLLCFGCKRENRPAASESDEVLITIGDSVLYRSVIEAAIPPGLSAADSARMFNNLATRWTEDMLLASIAEDYPMLTNEIDRRVEEYRRQLIVAEYRKLISRNEMSKVSEEKVRSYYDIHAAEMTTDEPIVKGLCLKTLANGELANSLRKWVKDGSPHSIENIERYGLTEAVQYDNFANRWIDWSALRRQIPGLKGEPAIGDYLEWPVNDYVWLVKITDALPAGSPMPYEYAAPSIRERLLYEGMDATEQDVVKQLYEKGLKAGTVKPGTFSPKIK